MSQMPPPMRVLPVIPPPPPPPGRWEGRPGSIGVVGVVSIILAIVGFGANMGSSVFSMVSFISAAEQKRAASDDDITKYPLLPQAGAGAPDGVDEQRAQEIVAGLTRVRPLSPKQASQVKLLAGNYGKRMFPYGASGITAARVRQAVSESGQMYVGPGKNADYFVLAEGRLEVSDTQAIYRADSGDVLRSGESASNSSLTEDQISRSINEIRMNGTAQPNPEQVETVRKLLRDPKQQIIGENEFIYWSGSLENGGVWFHTSSAQVRIKSDGTPMLLSSRAPIPGTNPFTGQPITNTWATLVLGESFLSGLLMGLLLFAGIQTVRGRPSGRTMHLIYAAIKLPLVIAGAIVLGFAVAEWVNAFSVTDPTRPPPAFASAMTVSAITCVLSFIWPLIVLLVMTRKSVKEYFRGVI